MLENQIKERLKSIEAARKAQEEAAAEAEQATKKDFTDATKELTELAKGLGVKGEIVTAKFGESAIPYATFAVMDVPVAIERRGSDLALLVDGEALPTTIPVEQDKLKDAVESMLSEAIAQIVDQRNATKPPAKAE